MFCEKCGTAVSNEANFCSACGQRTTQMTEIDSRSLTMAQDRGKEPKQAIRQYPWFWGWDGKVDFAGGPEFTGERFNDCYYTLS